MLSRKEMNCIIRLTFWSLPLIWAAITALAIAVGNLYYQQHKKKGQMTIAELKAAIAGLPDDTAVLVDTEHSDYDWEDITCNDLHTEYLEGFNEFIITAKIKDK